MKKRIITALLALTMLVTTLVVPAGAAETKKFSDLSDQKTSLAAETMRLMGVLDGYGDGTFRPNANLNRAQFCKMVTYAMAAGGELGRYRTVTVFPDVKPSHWAASYINLAAQGKHVIAGYPDGKFHPERTMTVGQAVTILLRLLGYKDENIGGVWPDSYMAMADTVKLIDGVGTNGRAPLTRAQAARLFVNLLQADKDGGGKLYELSEETTLISVDGGSGIMKTTDQSYSMVNPAASTSLTGASGRVVLKDGKALTFLPSSSGNGGIAGAAVILYQDRSAAGLSALAGNNDYRIYKNGTLASAGDLRKYDVATYNADTNSILVCDTRVSVYYESCEPSASAPTKIKVLGGTELNVLTTAKDTLAKFKPGQQITLLLTADGQVAGAVDADSGARGNAIAVVDGSGAMQMLCGTSVIPLKVQAQEKFYGQVVRISSSSKEQIGMSAHSGGTSGELNVSQRTLGNRPLAENVLIFDSGKLIGLSQLKAGIIAAGQIKYARLNWAGQVDLIVLNRNSGEIFGRVFVEIEDVPGEDGKPDKHIEKFGVEYGNGSGDRTVTVTTHFGVKSGDYVAAKMNHNGTGFSSVNKLAELKNVSKDSWIGDHAVTFGGRTYEVPADVQCYNYDSKEWVTLDQALAYADIANLYVKDGMVRVIEVRT